MKIEVKKAKPEDCEFIARMILASESTGTEVITFSKMFGLSNEVLVPLFTEMINNDLEGHPLTYQTFYIAWSGETPCGAISSYIESENGDSNLLMANTMISSLDRMLVMKGFQLSKQNSEVIIPKTKGYQQIDCVATAKEFRGRGIFSTIFEYILKDFRDTKKEGIEVQVWKGNPAVTVYEKVGFKLVSEYPSNTELGMAKLLLRK